MQVPLADQSGMVLPFTPLNLSFHHLNYYVPLSKDVAEAESKKLNNRIGQHDGKDMLQLLRDCSGSFRPGILTALVGSSGAGKVPFVSAFCPTLQCTPPPPPPSPTHTVRPLVQPPLPAQTCVCMLVWTKDCLWTAFYMMRRLTMLSAGACRPPSWMCWRAARQVCTPSLLPLFPSCTVHHTTMQCPQAVCLGVGVCHVWCREV